MSEQTFVFLVLCAGSMVLAMAIHYLFRGGK